MYEDKGVRDLERGPGGHWVTGNRADVIDRPRVVGNRVWMLASMENKAMDIHRKVGEYG